MKSLLFAVFLFVIYSCKQQTTPYKSYIPKEYTLSFDTLKKGGGKQFVFVEETRHDTGYSNFWVGKKDEQEYIFSTDFSQGKVTDSCITDRNGKVIERYTCIMNDSLDRVPARYSTHKETIINDGSKYGTLKIEKELTKNGLTLHFEGVMEYAKDTTVDIGGLKVDCIVMNGNTTILFKSNGQIVKTGTHNAVLYYGKNHGLVKHTALYDGSYSAWTVKSVVPGDKK